MFFPDYFKIAKTLKLHIFHVFCTFFLLFTHIWQKRCKNTKKVILTSKLSREHSFVGQNTQQIYLQTCILLPHILMLSIFQESKCMLLAYFVIMFLLFVILLVGGILGYVFRQQVRPFSSIHVYIFLMPYV